MTSALLLAALLTADCRNCDTASLVPYKFRPHLCRSLPYYGICPGCGSNTPGPAFDFRTEYNYFWYHNEFHPAPTVGWTAPHRANPTPAPMPPLPPGASDDDPFVPTPELVPPGHSARKPLRRIGSLPPATTRTASQLPPRR